MSEDVMRATGATLERTTFTVSRLLEFFTAKELQMQMGYDPGWWPVALLKELMDNALDACEAAGVVPEVQVTVEPDAVSVQDNGPGLPVSTLERSLDYAVRVSDKSYYVSPTRGQLGNALKCVWAAPYVTNGERGVVDVTTGGLMHRIEVSLDRIAQRPELRLTTSPDGLVKTGTRVTLHWPDCASLLDVDPTVAFYNYRRRPSAREVVRRYAAFNPHATILYRNTAHADEGDDYSPSNAGWAKWSPAEPTSPHWYTAERLRSLIAAYVAAEADGARPKTVREFISEFRGCSGTQRQKAITEMAGLSRAYLHDLVAGQDIDLDVVYELLAALQDASRPVKPRALGTIGEAHFRRWLVDYGYATPESVTYKALAGVSDGLPFVLELGFGVYREELSEAGSSTVVGLNWSPALQMPLAELQGLLGEARVDSYDPVVVLAHLSCPRLEFTDRGKSRLALPAEAATALAKGVKTITRGWTRAKRQADREGRLRERELDELRKRHRRRLYTIKGASYRVMAQAYASASANGSLPANARQIMYAARPGVLELTGGKCWKDSAYFTQNLLPHYVEDHPDETADWDVVYDARGKLMEPHTGHRADLGTLGVRRYIGRWGDPCLGDADLALSHAVDTSGPAGRYAYALFIEKEGFNELLAHVCLADRYDLAIMSTKGMSVTAARQLVARLSEEGVTILVLHDFDKAGLSILSTLRGDTWRWQYDTCPNVIDLGLRLADVQSMDLQSEPEQYTSKKDPRHNLRANGATAAECDFLVRDGYPGHWRGDRVELNAMASDQFVRWLEAKLEQAGVEKVIPAEEVLAGAYRRAVRLATVQQAMDDALEQLDIEGIDVPPRLGELVARRIQGQTNAWDDAVWEIATENMTRELQPRS